MVNIRKLAEMLVTLTSNQVTEMAEILEEEYGIKAVEPIKVEMHTNAGVSLEKAPKKAKKRRCQRVYFNRKTASTKLHKRNFKPFTRVFVKH